MKRFADVVWRNDFIIIYCKMEPRIKSIFEKESFGKTPNQVLKLLLFGQIKRVKELEEYVKKLEKKIEIASDLFVADGNYGKCKACDMWIYNRMENYCDTCSKCFCENCDNFVNCYKCGNFFCPDCSNDSICKLCKS